MEVFFTDNHAPDQAGLTPCPNEWRGPLALVKKLYDFSGLEQDPWLISGSNINSLNFKIGDYYIKLINVTDNDKKFVFDFPLMVEKLLNHNIPTQVFYSSISGRKIEQLEVNEKKYLVYVQNFLTSSFYSGTAAEFRAILDLISKIEHASADISTVVDSPKVYAYPDLSLLNSFIEETKKKPVKDDFDQFFLKSEALIIDAKNQCLHLKLRQEDWKILHCDLHPHNVLAHGKVDALLDLESFILMPIEVFRGFSLFKMARKSLSKKLMSLEDLKREILSAEYSPEALLVYAQLELLRRTLIILTLHYEKNDFRWDADLKKHLTGLEETRLIFI